MIQSKIKQLIISALFYLPLCFFVWFYCATVFVIPVKWLVNMALQWWQPDLFNGIVQQGFLLNVETLILLSQVIPAAEDKVAVLDLVINPMIYGYGLAVFSGLVLSVPDLRWQQRLLQLIVCYAFVVLIQAFGCFWSIIKILMVDAGQNAQQAILETGMTADLVAVMYQLSYLILPAVIPIILWILMNRKFVEALTHLTEQRENKELSSDDSV